MAVIIESAIAGPLMLLQDKTASFLPRDDPVACLRPAMAIDICMSARWLNAQPSVRESAYVLRNVIQVSATLRNLARLQRKSNRQTGTVSAMELKATRRHLQVALADII
ncbi:hypothetical protein KC353_g66 [Hortaea werneckii]|nr:hypothetical protein KC353_g66 [Hortaea werneckii]